MASRSTGNDSSKITPAKDQRSLAQDNNNKEVDIPVTATLPMVEKFPPYVTYVHSTRNQKMTDEQSVRGKRHMCYDQNGSEAIIYIDHSDEETISPREETYEFSEGEKHMIRMVSQTIEPSEKVVQTLARSLSRSTTEIREEITRLEKNDEEMNQNVFDESLASNMYIFDTVFCRRCLEFNCSLHGTGQPVIFPAERLEGPVLVSGQDEKPCSNQCYKRSYEDSTIGADPDIITWKPLEKDLYLEGVKIFGRNSCLIARTLLPGLKTCMEVYTRMGNDEPTGSSTVVDHPKDHENLASSGGRRGKRKKAGGHPRRIADGKQSNKQYTPCGCNVCGKGCPCFNNYTCCEKYCGCLKICKNRFRGCHCANRSQCRSQQCPCFAAGRECDPDICRNCWVSCGGGSLGEPQRRGQGQCGNMRLFLGQHQRVLMGKSDVAGWGVFVKNTIEKDEHLGEYTGELISQEEADLRGQLYDRVNSSFLFNLNDQYVIDALHLGNKLKFANHSPNPNCHASIIKVGGDHRVSIFAKERIEAGEEIFYDYCYEPEQSPSWARKPNDANGGPSSAPQARSKKPQLADPKEGPSVPPQAKSKKPRPHR
ncbi:putative [histone H3]-lysine(4) N-trimethyltransferase chromatin remodeling SET family [Helianthus annuus]|nr:putative [histone H3]-lysine(4) N-trimethyltransferase chromatin remodeling SET family [Helianthus annuus]